MSFPPKLALYLFSIMLVTGCTSKPELAEEESTKVVQITDNEDILQAETDLEQARQRHSEWMVREPALKHEPLPLGSILEYAKEKQAAGDTLEASRLAKKVSRFAHLGLEQALRQQQARPFYPQ